jgi:hypothetical protein
MGSKNKCECRIDIVAHEEAHQKGISEQVEQLIEDANIDMGELLTDDPTLLVKLNELLNKQLVNIEGSEPLSTEICEVGGALCVVLIDKSTNTQGEIKNHIRLSEIADYLNFSIGNFKFIRKLEEVVTSSEVIIYAVFFLLVKQMNLGTNRHENLAHTQINTLLKELNLDT